MDTSSSIPAQLAAGSATTEQALKIFDSLDPVSVESMLGNWRGEGFHTGHIMDGLLENYHWYGKRYDSAEHAHPLVFATPGGGRLCVNPTLMGPALALANRSAVLNREWLGRAFQYCLPLFATRKPRARLRMTEYRGKVSATMVYDSLPINDVFRRIDDNTVFGVMDFRGMRQPFFFILRRELAG